MSGDGYWQCRNPMLRWRLGAGPPVCVRVARAPMPAWSRKGAGAAAPSDLHPDQPEEREAGRSTPPATSPTDAGGGSRDGVHADGKDTCTE
jgi:hypothetical protein